MLYGLKQRKIITSDLSTIDASKPSFSPLIIEPITQEKPKELLLKITQNKEVINQYFKDYGIIMFKNFGIQTVSDYESFLTRLEINLSTEYRPGIAPRNIKSLSGKSFSSTEAPKYMCITPHNEMAYSNYRPSIISFWCKEEPKLYGETPLTDCGKLYNILPLKLQKKVRQPIVFKRKFTNKKTSWDGGTLGGTMWKSSFNTNNKKEVEEFCKKVGIKYKWDNNENIDTIVEIESILTHTNNKKYIQLQTPLLGKYIYLYLKNKYPKRFNNSQYNELINSSNYCPPIQYNFLDNTRLTKEEVEEYMDNILKCTIFPKWKKGDIWLIDNIKYAHSRMNVDTAPKSKREIIASLGNFIDIRNLQFTSKI